MNKKIDKILIIRPDALGDMVLTLPLLSALSNQFPDAEIKVLCKTFIQPFLKHLPSIHSSIQDRCELKNIKLFSKAFFDYARFLRQQNFDAVILAYQDPFYAALCFFARIPIRIGDKNRVLESFWLTDWVALDFASRQVHEIENRLRLGQPLGLEKDHVPQVNIEIPAFAKVFVQKSIQQTVGLEKSLVGIHASLGQGNRAWHAKRYAQLIDRLDAAGYAVVLTGQGKDKDAIDAILQHTQTHVMNALDSFDLIQLAALWQHCAVVMGAETGPIHLAAILKRPIVNISPTKFIESFRWGPLTTAHEIICEATACSFVCHTYQNPCQKPDCLDSISVQQVFQAVKRVESKTFESIQKNKRYWQEQSAKIAIFLPKYSAEVWDIVKQLQQQYQGYRHPLVFFCDGEDRDAWQRKMNVLLWPKRLKERFRFFLQHNFTHQYVFKAWDYYYMKCLFLGLGANINAAPHLKRVL